MTFSMMGELFRVLYTYLIAEALQCLPMAEDESGDASTHAKF